MVLLPLLAVAAPTVPERFELPFVATTHEEAVAWQVRARARLFALVEAQQPRRPTADLPLAPALGQPEDRGGYLRHPVTYTRDDGRRGEALLAIPKGAGPFPAMLCLHGHGGSAERVFDAGSEYKALADGFARGGYVVLAPTFEHREYCALTLWDLLRCVDLLAGRPEVDADRIGVAGLSMGGEWTMWAAACDERLKVAVVSGWMCTTEGVLRVPNCPCWMLPGLLELMDICEVHLLIAPRPVLFESAERDPCFPIDATRAGFARIRSGYAVFGAAEAVEQDTWDAGHEWHGLAAYPFVDRVLGGRAGA